MEAISRTP